jgi:dephospho-CoA kinase
MAINKSFIVGITGGIGSGKSTICKIFKALGWPVYDADAAGKRLLAENRTLRQEVSHITEIRVDIPFDDFRKILGEKIFANKSLREAVEGLIHPAVQTDFDQWCLDQSSRIILKEAAILFETGSWKSNDFNILVTAPKAIRIKRILERDPHLNQQTLLERMAAQWPDEKKVPLANAVIDNSGTYLLTPQILTVYENIIRLANKGN